MAEFISYRDVEDWVNENGIDKLREMVGVSVLGGSSLALGKVWLQEHDRKAAEAERLARSARWRRWVALAVILAVLPIVLGWLNGALNALGAAIPHP